MDTCCMQMAFLLVDSHVSLARHFGRQGVCLPFYVFSYELTNFLYWKTEMDIGDIRKAFFPV